ncbi:MAG: 3-deoxy-8-phosphooctulonate synthase [Alphaproteobacteria bacterium]
MTQQHVITVRDIKIGNDLPFVLLGGPCAIESREHAFRTAGELKHICDRLGIPLIYKSSYDKANRTSLGSGRGIGMEEGLRILSDVRDEFGCPVVTDVHLPDQCATVGEVVDVLQIPAFLCRQTDLVVAAAKTGKPVNVKKGQFLAPWDMPNVVAKVTETGNPDVMICDRGTSFGYNTLISDFRGLPQYRQTGHPIVFDATHSVQQPGGQGGTSGGQREFVPVLARAAVSIGVAALFMETTPTPETAISDGPNMVPLDEMEAVLKTLLDFDRLAKDNPINL